MMSLFTQKSRILIPLELPDPEELPGEVADLLGSTRILLLGWYRTPEQTSPEQAREEAEDTGEEALESAAERLRDAGAEVDTRHVFTPELMATVQRIGVEEECDAALLAGPVRKLDRILVVLREDVAPGTLGTLLSDITGHGAERVTLLQISRDEADEGRNWSDRVLDALEAEGVDTDRVETRVETADDPPERVLQECRDGDFDLVLIPEKGELEEQLFGSFAEKVAAEAELPVLVVRVRQEKGES